MRRLLAPHTGATIAAVTPAGLHLDAGGTGVVTVAASGAAGSSGLAVTVVPVGSGWQCAKREDVETLVATGRGGSRVPVFYVMRPG